jgi:hypothetical protein
MCRYGGIERAFWLWIKSPASAENRGKDLQIGERKQHEDLTTSRVKPDQSCRWQTQLDAADNGRARRLAVAIAAVWLFGGSGAGDEPVSYTTTFTESCTSTGAYEDGYEVYTCTEVSPDPRWAGMATLWYSSTGNRFELANEGGTWTGTSGPVGGDKYEGSGLGSGGYEGLQYTYEGRLPTFTVTVESIP